MKYILDAAQMKEVDNYSISTVGIPSVVLMGKGCPFGYFLYSRRSTYIHR